MHPTGDQPDVDLVYDLFREGYNGPGGIGQGYNGQAPAELLAEALRALTASTPAQPTPPPPPPPKK